MDDQNTQRDLTAKEQFDLFNNSVPNEHRVTIATFSVRTYGSEDQRRQTIENIKQELELRGYQFEMDSVVAG